MTNWFLFDKEEEDDDVVVDEVIVGQILARKRSWKVKSMLWRKLKDLPPSKILGSYIMYRERVIQENESMVQTLPHKHLVGQM